MKFLQRKIVLRPPNSCYGNNRTLCTSNASDKFSYDELANNDRASGSGDFDISPLKAVVFVAETSTGIIKD